MFEYLAAHVAFHAYHAFAPRDRTAVRILLLLFAAGIIAVQIIILRELVICFHFVVLANQATRPHSSDYCSVNLVAYTIVSIIFSFVMFGTCTGSPDGG